MWTRSVPEGEVRRLGDRALLAGVRDARAARTLIGAIGAAAPPGVAEVVGGLATVMVSVVDDGDPEELLPLVEELLRDAEGTPDAVDGAGRLVTVACVFDGPDLAEVAEVAGCRPDEVGPLLTASPLTVAVVGFSPGFAYLEGLLPALSRVPRRRSPRPVVPPGSVALANGHAAVYPSASPGGWQLIGRTAARLFDPRVAPYALLAPGDRVQFVAAGQVGPAPPVTPGAPPPAASAHPVFAVDQPGLRTLRQDAGRRGVAGVGVPAAGPADPRSFQLANRLVGNPAGAGALEVTARGPILRGLRPAFVAVVGARPDVSLQGRPAPLGRVVPVDAGQRFSVGQVRDGLRCYVAVAGGLVGPELMGSCASDLLCGLGPAPLARGDELEAGAVVPPLGDHVPDDVLSELTTRGPVTLRVVPGPHPERFAPGAFASLTRRRFTVEAESNRIGLRLRDGDGPVPSAGAPHELDSQGTVTGAVQVPPDGRPIVLLPDHATLGGYPVVAVVAAVDHGLLGQCAPGSTVVLAPVTHAESRRAWALQRRRLATAVVGHYPLALG